MEDLRGMSALLDVGKLTMIVLGLLVLALALSLFEEEVATINTACAIVLKEKHALVFSLTGDAELRMLVVAKREQFKIK
jgi:hypothetical protein